ncbi:MAG: glycosyltransferase family 2 protein [Candidatus Bathyarchaeota archaeon]|nr:glycosyltransferase family 2 protein [Candidatus Bathyarchaeota archaeon]
MNLDDVADAYKKASHIWDILVPEPQDRQDETTRFIFVCPFRNTGQFLALNIYSILSQTYGNYKACFIDDNSNDDSVSYFNTLVDGNTKFQITTNDVQRYALENISDTIKYENPDDEDVIILLDGDDWLSCPHVLSYLNHVYTADKCWMTYGSYCFFPFKGRGVEPSEYPPLVIENNAYRKDVWRASHLRTFKYKLWKHLKQEDLQYNGSYFKFAYDQAIMLPLLEMSGNKAKYIDKTLHVYNRSNPGNVDKTHAQEQTAIANYVRSRPAYERLS